MKEFFGHAPQIIEQAAKSTLGILALMVLGLAFIGFLWFRKAPVKTRVAIFILLFLGVAGFAAVVAYQAIIVANPSPKPPGPESAIAGNWMETIHDANKIKYATVQIRYAPATSSFELSGRTFKLSGEGETLVASPRSEWRSLSFKVQPQAGNCEVVYTYRAVLKEGPLHELDGFGEYTFYYRKEGICNQASGFYKDTQVKEAVQVDMRRLNGDYDRLFADDPGELIRRYHKSRKDFESQ